MPAAMEQAKAREGASKSDAVVIDPDDGYTDSRSVRQQWLECVLFCLCNVAWTVDTAILPLFFKEFQVLFGVSQTHLSTLMTAKGWAAALFAFPCGFLGEILPRPRLVGLGMVFWAAGLGICACAQSFETLFAGRVLNGVGLGIVQPLLLSLVADKSPPTKRGSAFGSMFFVGAVVNTLFGLVATTFADKTVLGVAGWRISVGVVAGFSAVVGLAIAGLVIEPHAAALATRTGQGCLQVFTTNMPKVIQLFKYPTFVLILCQGAPGTAPWTVFPFFTQWLELACFTHAETGWIVSMFGWGIAFSNLVTGLLLNFVSTRFPNHGPPTMANFSVAVGLPFLVLFYFVFPKPPHLNAATASDMWVYSIGFLLFGLGCGMCGTINKKVFSDVVPPAIFTYVFAIDQLIENGLGNLAGVAVGYVTDRVFHYNKDAIQADSCEPTEAHKLGLGMFWVCNVAWLICFCVYSGMHITYPKDRRAQLALRRAEAEARQEKASAQAVELGSQDDAADREDAKVRER